MARMFVGWKSSIESVVPGLVVEDMVSYAAYKCASVFNVVC